LVYDKEYSYEILKPIQKTIRKENKLIILQILNELSDTTSTKEKEAIIRREKDNILLKQVFQAAYNPMITYGIKQIPEYETMFSNPTPINFSIQYLNEKLVTRKLTGNAAINWLSAQLADMLKDDAIVLERIIQRDLRCGCSDTIASRVWPGLVPTHDVMLSHKDITHITYPALAQIKSDGARCHLYFDGAHAVATSRSGKTIELCGMFDNDLGMMLKAGDTIDGELVCFRNGKMLDRKTGNGIINKAIKGTITPDEAKLIHFMTWDLVDFTSTIPYDLRLVNLQTRHGTAAAFDAFENKIIILDTVIVHSEEEAQDFYQTCIDAGEEGAMIKNMKGLWEPKRSKNIGKMKAEEVADLLVVGVQEGTGKYVGMVGALICETSDGLLHTNVGTGLSDADRNVKDYIGKIVEVKYNQLITSRSKDTASLFLPRFMSVRFDKDIANTLGELK
jgi:hypothetical protein